MGRLPSVDELVRAVDDGRVPRPLVVEAARSVIASARERGGDPDLGAELRERLAQLRHQELGRVVNATGVILHTNLGRAPWSQEAVAAAARVAGGYANVELDLASGERGGRSGSVTTLLTALTGAEAAHVVGNNAGALFLTLLALGSDGPVPVSRGELIEIGGSYRLPELMAAAGASLVEVGTTNRTRLDDYRSVAGPTLLLKVHPSNYRVVGFTAETSIGDLAGLAFERGIPLVFDAGSGLLDERVPWLEGPPPSWLAGEPGVRQALAGGADLVLFSGDKLLGGPQAGIIVGRRQLVDRLRRHPAARAMRLDAPTAAALAATLSAYLAGTAHALPVWAMATADVREVGRRAREVMAGAGIEALVVDGVSTLGAGSAPGAEIPTRLIEMGDADRRHALLLGADPPVLARRAAGRLLIDLRTVEPADDAHIAAILAKV